jgi:lysozyme family protein
MANFLLAWAKTSKNEAGYVNDPADKGGETYRGITMRFCPDWDGWDSVHSTIAKLGIKDTLGCSKEVRQKIDKVLSIDPAVDDSVQRFYKKRYWDVLGLDSEASQLIANDAFDTAVLMGIGAEKQIEAQAKKEYNV